MHDIIVLDSVATFIPKQPLKSLSFQDMKDVQAIALHCTIKIRYIIHGRKPRVHPRYILHVIVIVLSLSRCIARSC